MVWCCTPELCERSVYEAQFAAEGPESSAIMTEKRHERLTEFWKRMGQ